MVGGGNGLNSDAGISVDVELPSEARFGGGVPVGPVSCSVERTQYVLIEFSLVPGGMAFAGDTWGI